VRDEETVEQVLARPYAVSFEYGDSPEEGVLAYLAEWPDCFAAGRTRRDALHALEATMRELAAYRLRRGLEIPKPAEDFSGRFVLRLPKQLHRDVERRAQSEGVSLNTWLTQAVAREVGPARGGRAH
jgi:antitoxin HicB